MAWYSRTALFINAGVWVLRRRSSTPGSRGPRCYPRLRGLARREEHTVYAILGGPVAIASTTRRAGPLARSPPGRYGKEEISGNGSVHGARLGDPLRQRRRTCASPGCEDAGQPELATPDIEAVRCAAGVRSSVWARSGLPRAARDGRGPRDEPPRAARGDRVLAVRALVLVGHRARLAASAILVLDDGGQHRGRGHAAALAREATRRADHAGTPGHVAPDGRRGGHDMHRVVVDVRRCQRPSPRLLYDDAVHGRRDVRGARRRRVRLCAAGNADAVVPRPLARSDAVHDAGRPRARPGVADVRGPGLRRVPGPPAQ